ncbi:LytTR family DNA-binding domain-containing protein [Dysgonomonas sp. Marseille-P4677]|uniref:LytR/AlgR family response regulator transcription factor n=1 Tax=Dysgonomonas sp. Marseille-P4677 TaxID=2364790 RepID=UPI001F178A9D|nr:LytTR family DNA-binding domain-containing protein [Dysgonomonas sp. Marseille-P4677]
MKPLLNVPDCILVTDAIISGIILSVLLLLLSNTSRCLFSNLSPQQKFINFGALAVLFTVSWIGSEFLVLYILISTDEFVLLSTSIPIRIVIALLSYSLSILISSQMHSPLIEEGIASEIETSNEENDLTEKEETENIEIIERVAVKNGQKIDVVLVTEIIHLQAEGDYVMIHSIKGKFLKEQTMKSFEKSLPQDKFVRVHRSSIINIDFILQIELYDRQNQLLKLKNGSQVKISLSGYKSLKKTLGL